MRSLSILLEAIRPNRTRTEALPRPERNSAETLAAVARALGYTSMEQAFADEVFNRFEWRMVAEADEEDRHSQGVRDDSGDGRKCA